MRFKTPVVVEPGVLGRFRIVLGPSEALSVLEGRWPEKQSQQYARAVFACREALEGRKPVHLARSSFVAAAKAARVFVSADDSCRYTVGALDLAAVFKQRRRRSLAACMSRGQTDRH